MAFPTDPPNPAGANETAFANARLTPEEAERLAATFRPSWEIDEPPFKGALPLPQAGSYALKGGGGTQADIRGAVPALNGTHAPAPATILRDEPMNSVVIDEAVDAEVAPVVARAAAESPPARQSPTAKSGTLVLPAARAATAQQRTLVMPGAPGAAFAKPRARPSAPSFDLGQVTFANRTNLRLWIALGGAAGVLLSAGVWLASSSGDKKLAAPDPAAQATVATATSRIPPPPPPETFAPAPTASAAPPPAPALPPQAATAAAPPPATIASPPRFVVPPAPRPPSWTPGPSPARPAARPKAGQTIVRDVPF